MVNHKLIILISLVIASSLSKAQKSEALVGKLDSLFLVFPGEIVYVSEAPSDYSYTSKKAKSDIAKQQVIILFSGGFGGMPDFENKRDGDFQAKYNVKFASLGCLRGQNDDQEGYNREVFKYLDSMYGYAWRKEIRPTAIGLEEFLKGNGSMPRRAQTWHR